MDCSIRDELDALVATLAGLRVVSAGDGPDDRDAGGVAGYSMLVQRTVEAFGASDVEDVRTQMQHAIDRACTISNEIAVSQTVDEGDYAKANLALSVLYYMNHAVSASMEAHRLLCEGASAGGPTVRPTAAAGQKGGGSSASEDRSAMLVAGIARFSVPDPEEANRFQQLLLFLLGTAASRGYRKRDGQLYRPRRLFVSAAERETHSWECVGDIRSFVYDVTRKEINYEMWLNLTCQRTNVQSAVDHLAQCRDVQLPDLLRDRHVFSFRNGVYLANEDEFCAYGSERHASLPADLVAAKYFDVDMPIEAIDGCEWREIETPHLQSILDYQGMDAEVSRWLYVMVGRLVYEVNEMDKWQVIPFLKGAASSGKSTLLMHVCRGLYEDADVGVLSNNVERKFGLSGLVDKLLFIGPEIKGDIQLEQAEFQSIVSGECLQVAAKFKTSSTVKWTVPGALAGNEVPGWIDNSGSINRRVVLFEFPKRVHDGDMDLGRKLDAELPLALVKANRAYREAAAMHARDNIWKHLPQAFHTAKDEFTESVNSIVHFLRSGALEFQTGAYMPFEQFVSAYNTYVTSMGLPKIKLTGDKVTQPLMEARCRVLKKDTRPYPRHGPGPGFMTTGRFIVGCDFAAASSPAAISTDDPLDA